MKKNYIIPNTASVAFHAGSICQTSASGTNVQNDAGLQPPVEIVPGGGEPL